MMDRRMSWLSPKRRRTTGNLKTLANGHRRATSDEPPLTASIKEMPTSELPSPTKQASHPSVHAIISAQDEGENILAGSKPWNEELGQSRKEVNMHSEVSRLEEQFNMMIEAAEKNTEGVNRLAQQHKEDVRTKNGRPYALGEEDKSNEIAGHLWRMGDLFSRNMEHIEGLTKRQMENERKLDYMLENMNTKQNTNNVDMAQLSAHLDRIQHLMERSVVEREEERRGREDADSTELSQMSEKIEMLQQSIDENSAAMQGLSQDGRSTSPSKTNQLPRLNLAPLLEHMDKLHTVLQEHSTRMEELVEVQTATKKAVENDIDFAPLAEHMVMIRESIERIPETISVSTEHIREVIGARTTQSPSSIDNMDLVPLTDRLNQIHATLQDIDSKLGEQPSGTGDPNFFLTALSSHLRKIQTVAEQNSNAVKTLVANAKQQRNDTDSMEKRLEATNGQVRELTAGQREMTSVMRELAQAITAQNKGCCEHVVIPPPRKMGRKVVGFVYDAKEAAV